MHTYTYNDRRYHILPSLYNEIYQISIQRIEARNANLGQNGFLPADDCKVNKSFSFRQIFRREIICPALLVWKILENDQFPSTLHKRS